MRIVIDMQGAQTGSRFRGIGRYTMALAAAMIKLRGEHEIILALNGLFPETIDSIRDAFAELLPQENIKVWSSVGPVHAFDPANEWRKDIAELIREEFLASLKPDLVHVTSLMEGFGDDAVHSIGRAPFKVPTAVTFYDLIPLIKSDVYFAPNPGFERLYREKISHLNRAELMLAISESSREEALEYLDLADEKIVNISAAVDDIFKPVTYTHDATKRFNKKYGVSGKYLMYSGATDDRKNHIGLISAYALLPVSVREEYQLVLVGGLPDDHRFRFEQHISKCKLSQNDVIITGRVSDDDLVQFYNQCALYIFPSLHEGFGLPVLEAMSCGAAAIGSNTTSVPEVIGNAEALFDPHSEQAITDKILQVLRDPGLLQSLREHGVIQAKNFTWEISAQLTLRAFEKWFESHGAQAARNLAPSSEADRRDWLLDEVARLGPIMADTEIRRVAQAIATHTQSSIKQLLVDVSGLVNRNSVSGVSYIVERLLRELLASPPDGYVVTPVYATKDEFGYRYAGKLTDAFLNQASNDQEDYNIDFCQGDIFLGLDVEHNVQAKQASFYQYLRRIGISVYFILYELEPLLKSSMFLGPAFFEDHDQVALSRYMDGVICVSEHVSRELRDWLEKNAEPRARKLEIGSFSLGAEVKPHVAGDCESRPLAELSSEVSKSVSFFLDARRMAKEDLHKIISTFNGLWFESIDVVLVVVSSLETREVQSSKELIKEAQKTKLLWVTEVDQDIFSNVQAACKCFIAAYQDEVFGLSLVEAAANGLSIIACDSPLHREVAGEHALYFNREELEGLAIVIRKWLALYQAGRQPISENIKLISWQESARRLMSLVLSKK
ncbi:glycosyltransferase [Pseudomonas sp. LS2P72]